MNAKMMKTKKRKIVLRQLNPCPLLTQGHRKYCPKGLQPTHPFNNGDSWGVRRPRVPLNFFPGVTH